MSHSIESNIRAQAALDARPVPDPKVCRRSKTKAKQKKRREKACEKPVADRLPGR